MLTYKKLTMLNKVNSLKFWITEYLTDGRDGATLKDDLILLQAIDRNIKSILALINKS